MSDLLSEDVKQTNSSESQELKPKGHGLPSKACVNCGGVWEHRHCCPKESEKCGSCGKTGHCMQFCRFSNSQAKKNDSGEDNNQPEDGDNDESLQDQCAKCEQTSYKADDKENLKWEKCYDFHGYNYCEKDKRQKHLSIEKNDNYGRKKSTNTASSFPGEDQPIYCKKTKYPFNFAGQTRYNLRPWVNHRGPGYTFIPETQYESIELKKKLAKQFYAQGEYEAALSYYSRLTVLCPNNAVFFNNKCACYMMLGQYENAFADAVKAINLNPSSIKGHSRLIKCGILLGTTATVELSLSKLSLLDPNHETLQSARETLNKLENYLEKEKIAVSGRNYQKALRMARKCLSISPEYLPFKLKKAEYLVLVGRYNDSIKLVDEILQKDPRNIEAKYIRGLIMYYDDGISNSARDIEKYFKSILHLAPDHVKSLAIYKNVKFILETRHKGYEAFKSKNYIEAYNLYSSVLQIDPHNTGLRKGIYRWLGYLSFSMGNFQQAIEEFSEVIRMDPESTRDFTNRGQIYMLLGNHEEATADFSRACDLDNGNADCQELLQDAKEQLALDQENSYEILGVYKYVSIEEIGNAYKDETL